MCHSHRDANWVLGGGSGASSSLISKANRMQSTYLFIRTSPFILREKFVFSCSE